MISIALCTYNGERYIRKQLESIINQSKKADEIVIVDDCSQDGTISIITDFINKYKNVDIRLVKNDSNIGYVDNFKKAITLCNGDIIYLSDQDDIWLENKIEKMNRHMEDNRINVLFSSYECIDKDDNSVGFKYNSTNSIIYNIISRIKKPIKYSYKELYKFINIPGMSMAIKKDVAVKLVNEDFSIINYHDLSISTYASLLDSIYFINECLVLYRLHDNNSIGLSINKEKEDREEWLRRYVDIQQRMLDFMSSLNTVKVRDVYRDYLLDLISFNNYRLECFERKKYGIKLFTNALYYSGVKSLIGDLVYILKNKV